MRIREAKKRTDHSDPDLQHFSTNHKIFARSFRLPIPKGEDVLLFAGCDPLLDVGPAHRVRRGGQGHVRVSARRPHAHRCISPGRLLLHMQTVRIGN
jgi:hypothetical protein